MRKLIVALALLAIVAPAFADLSINLVPKSTGATAPMRPEVNDGWIAAANGEGSGNTGGILYDVYGATVYGNQATVSLMNVGYWHEPQADISDNYAVFGGANSSNSVAIGINVLKRSDNSIINIPCLDANEHLTSINNAGDVVWLAWGDGPRAEGLWHSNVSSGTATAPVLLAATPGGSGGARVRMSTDARRVAYRPENSGPGGQTMWVYDLATAQNVKIWDMPTMLGPNGAVNDGKAYLSGIDDTGNWVVTNMRSVAAGGQWSDVYLFNTTNLGAVTSTRLFNNTAAIREDPRFEQLDADTGILVWNEDPTGGNSLFNVRYAYVTGLTGTPTLGTPVDITTRVAGVSNCRWADVDQSANGDVVVAWLNTATQQIEYTIIPEPASLALLSLAGLALLRRR